MRFKRWIGSFFLLLLLFAYVRSPYAKIDSLTVTGQTRLTEEDILSWAGVKAGDSLFVWWPEVIKRIEAHEAIKRATFSWSFPNRFHLTIEEWPVYGLLLTEGALGGVNGSMGEKRWLILENGRCTPPRKNEMFAGYPLIRYSPSSKTMTLPTSSGQDTQKEKDSTEVSLQEEERLANVCRDGAQLLGALDPDTYAHLSEIIWDDPSYPYLIHLYLSTGDEILVEQEHSKTLVRYYQSLRASVPADEHGRFFLLENGSYFEPYSR